MNSRFLAIGSLLLSLILAVGCRPEISTRHDFQQLQTHINIPTGSDSSEEGSRFLADEVTSLNDDGEPYYAEILGQEPVAAVDTKLTFENAQHRCNIEMKAESSYRLDCFAKASKDGEVVAFDGVDAGTEIEWADPEFVEGHVTFYLCMTLGDSGLKYRCDFHSDSKNIKVNVGFEIRDPSKGKDRLEKSIFDIPVDGIVSAQGIGNEPRELTEMSGVVAYNAKRDLADSNQLFTN